MFYLAGIAFVTFDIYETAFLYHALSYRASGFWVSVLQKNRLLLEKVVKYFRKSFWFLSLQLIYLELTNSLLLKWLAFVIC